MLTSGPLQGVRIIELAGLGPITFASMVLADMGADVVRVARPSHVDPDYGATLRGRERLTLDLRTESGLTGAQDLALNADVLLEGFRPGVTERLGLSPATLLSRNPSLVYGRMTGWGQDGVRSATAGHDIDYIAVTGALHAIGDQDPAVPLNLVGDYGGGAMYLVAGVLAAVLHARASGAGQIVDCAICDGTVSLLSLMYGLRDIGRWKDTRQSNVLDGAAPFYRTYRCLDGKHLAVGAIEPAFNKILIERLGLQGPLFSVQHDRSLWSQQAAAMQEVIATRTRDDWCEMFKGSDACVAPVNSLQESLSDPHLASRSSFVNVDGEMQPAPAPRFSATPSDARASRDAILEEVLQRWSSPSVSHATA